MRNQLEAHTEQGKQLVALCEEHAIDFMTRAAQHDRENTFVAENLAAMRKTRVLAACVPEEYGGLGVTSVHDIMVAVSRLARGCASSAISWNMHVTNTLGIRRWLTATEAGIASAERRDLPEALRVLRPMRKQYAMFLTGIARYGAVLLTGDIEERDERLLLAAGGELAAATLLAPHHGSGTSSSAAFLGAVRPVHAVFTVGYRNRFGHPKEAVLARYAAAGANVWRTDRDGAVTVKLEEGGTTVARYRERSPRYWRWP